MGYGGNVRVSNATVTVMVFPSEVFDMVWYVMSRWRTSHFGMLRTVRESVPNHQIGKRIPYRNIRLHAAKGIYINGEYVVLFLYYHKNHSSNSRTHRYCPKSQSPPCPPGRTRLDQRRNTKTFLWVNSIAL